MTLPFIITIPHCSVRIPEYVRPQIQLSEKEIYDSMDLGTLEIFGSISAHNVFAATWSRLFVDLNRGPDQHDPKGVVPLKDYYGRDLYKNDAAPGIEEIERRVREHHQDYHNFIEDAVRDNSVKAIFDCHSLNGVGPVEAPDRGEKRKDIVLGNNGDKQGREIPGKGMITCQEEKLLKIRRVFERASFTVSLNYPYSGGFITRHYGKRFGMNGKSALQIEVNQDLFLNPSGDGIDEKKLNNVREQILRVFDDIGELF